jgi:hypothetical protein
MARSFGREEIRFASDSIMIAPGVASKILRAKKLREKLAVRSRTDREMAVSTRATAVTVNGMRSP